MPVLPITTERLHLRMMRPDDLDVLLAYRNDPEVARFQDWELPATAERTSGHLEAQAHLDDIEVGRWVQVAIEHDGAVVGDVMIGYLAAGAIAMIGYTLAPAWQGRGFASEAVRAVVDAIFAATDVHRIAATLDPANVASMRVIEPLGFRHEGTTRRSELIRGEWVDDMVFGLLRTDREEWLSRPTGLPERVELVELSPENLRAVTRLATFTFQERFVAPVPRSLAQALVPPIHPVHQQHPVVPWYRAIVADGEVAGFVMLSAVTEWEPVPYLWRLLIDARHQRRGIGERAIARLVEQARAAGHAAMMVSYVEAPGGPKRFYERLGFVPTGEMDGDETVARLDITPA